MAQYYFKVLHGDRNETELVVSSNRESLEEVHRSRVNEFEDDDSITVKSIQKREDNTIFFNSDSYIE